MDHLVGSAQTALQVVNVPTPAAADSMHIIIRCGDDDGSFHMLQQVLQALEGGGRLPVHGEWFDTVVKCRIAPAADAGVSPGTRREWFAHN